MNEIFFILIYLFILLIFLGCLLALPITSLIIAIRSKRKLNQRLANLEASLGLKPVDALLTNQVHQLTIRVQRLEAVISSGEQTSQQVVEPTTKGEPQPKIPKTPPPPQAPPQQTKPPQPSTPHRSAAEIESVIGRRWIGWIAVTLILFATAFFLKYAFDNRWIGEVGRVAIGIFAGVLMVTLGYRYFKRGWQIFSQILTGGGVVLLYLSTYAAFGYYHLVPQKAAFAFLIVLIAEAAILSLLYGAPAIAIMALIGGFLTPLLLHSDRDQYLSLFGYILLLDLGALAVLKHWKGLRTIAFIGSHLLFWLWYDQHYTEQRLLVVVLFHIALFLVFLFEHLAARLFRQNETISIESIWLLVVNPFVFFITSYQLLNPFYHDWMGVFAIVMAIVYAGGAKLLIDRTNVKQAELLSLIGISLTFTTIAIPIQLSSNWITIAWALEALTMLWAGIETRALRLRISAYALFWLALSKLLFWDTPYGFRPAFIPIFNRYFLSSLLVIGCLFAAVALLQTLATRKKVSEAGIKLGFLVAALFALWLVSSIETYTFFQMRAIAQRVVEDAQHQRWLGQMALSVVWAVYAAVLAAIGFVRRSSATRWAALALFALTVVKAMLVDIAALQQLYRIIVFFVLGVLLLLVAWGYHKAFQARESST